MHDNRTLRDEVVAALDWEPSVDSSTIAVSAKEGVVTLSGHVSTYAQKIKAEQVVKSVRGVRALAEELEVRPADRKKTADDEIAKRALNMLDWDVMAPADDISIKVQDGWVTLSGQADWEYQRRAAEADVRRLSGVIGVTNRIAIKPRAQIEDIKSRIENALKRDAEVDATNIRISVANGKVKMEGHVRSWHERRVAENAVWAAAGVSEVDDRLTISA